MFFLNLFNAAYAEQAAPPAPGGFAAFVPFILIFAIFYFLMIRPQKKRLQEEQNMLNALGKGDEIFTKSGILGKITGISDKVVTLEVADGVMLKVLRAQIGGLARKLFNKGK